MAQTPNRREWIPPTAGVIVSALALTVLLGWWMESEALVRIRAGLAVMQFNTALSFLLSGVGLWLLWRGYMRGAAILGALTALLAMCVLAEHVTGLNLGIDTLFIQPDISDSFAPAGRMSLPTTLVFLAAGSALFLGALYAQRTVTATAVGSLAAFILSLGGMALVGYGTALIGSQAVVQLQAMALHTSLGAFVLGLGLAAMVPAIARLRLDGITFWVAGPVAVCAATVALFLWLAVAEQQQQRIRDLLSARATAFETILGDTLERRSKSLRRVGQAWVGAQGRPTLAVFQDRQLLQALVPELQALLLLRPNRAIWLMPDHIRPDTWMLSYADALASWRTRPHRPGGPTVQLLRQPDGSPPNGELRMVVPIPEGDAGSGFMVALLDVEQLIGPTADSYLARGYATRLMADDLEFFARQPLGADTRGMPGYTHVLRLATDQVWLINLELTPDLALDMGSRLPLSTLLVGLSFAGLLAVAAHLWQRSLKGRREAELLNLQLARENEVRTWAEDHFRSLVDAAPNALLIVDAAGRITLVNTHTLSLFGYRQDELMGKPVEALIPARLRGPHPEWRSRYTHTPVKRPMGTGRELYGLRKDGSEFPVDISLSPLQSQDGLEVICSIVDMTARQQTEDELRRANSSLQQVNQELESFSHSVSHDLRQPLRAMIGFGEILQEDYADKLDAEGHRCIERIQSAAIRMGQLIDDLLNLSRVTRSQMQMETVDLGGLAKEVIEALRQQDSDRDVAVRIDPELHTQGDPRMLRIVLENLLSNAWKFTGRTEAPRIEVGALKENGRPVFYVRDNGDGFDMAYQDQLFAAFQRLHGVEEFPGTGVGLATVQRIINRHHGRIWAQAEKGKGATFYFSL